MPAEDFFAQAADAAVRALPEAVRATVDASGHVVDPEALAPLLPEFATAP